MIPRLKPYFDMDEIKSLVENTRDSVVIFEKKFADIVGNKYALLFPHARSALFAIFHCQGITKREIVIPSYTSISVPAVILASNNIPIFTDISLRDYNPSISDILSKITKNTTAIIPSYIYGYPMNLKKMREELRENILIIDDAALGFCTSQVGKFSDIAFYSLAFKQLFTFGGGVATTNNEEIYHKLKEYRDSNFCTKESYNVKKFFNFTLSYLAFNRCFYNAFNLWHDYILQRFYHEYLYSIEKQLPKDFLYCYSLIQAKIGLAQLNKANEIINRRKQIAHIYNSELQGLSNISLPPLIKGATYCYYTIRVKNREKFMRKLLEKGVQSDFVFPYSCPHLPNFRQYANECFDNSKTAAQHVVNLPCYPSLLDKPSALEQIVESIKKING